MAPVGNLPSVLFIGNHGDAEVLTSGPGTMTPGPVLLWGQFGLCCGFASVVAKAFPTCFSYVYKMHVVSFKDTGLSQHVFLSLFIYLFFKLTLMSLSEKDKVTLKM